MGKPQDPPSGCPETQPHWPEARKDEDLFFSQRTRTSEDRAQVESSWSRAWPGGAGTGLQIPSMGVPSNYQALAQPVCAPISSKVKQNALSRRAYPVTTQRESLASEPQRSSPSPPFRTEIQTTCPIEILHTQYRLAAVSNPSLI